MKSLSLLLACLVPASATAAVPAAKAEQTKQIEAVIEAFRTSIIAKDKESFVKLFLHPNVTWQNVVSDESLAIIRKKNPEALKVRVSPDKKNYTTFIDGIVAAPEKQEEKFSNVRVESDGDVASVFFDYSFHSDGRQTNHGKEAWHLVRTGDGWKIASVIWSVIADPPPAK